VCFVHHPVEVRRRLSRCVSTPIYFDTPRRPGKIERGGRRVLSAHLPITFIAIRIRSEVMGFVRPNQPDIFISYAQVDDDPVPGWVSGFVDGLESSLKMELGPGAAKQLHVFRDFQLSTGALIGQELQKEVEDSATLLLILSKAYLKSVWTPAELKWFVDHIGVRNLDASGTRIFPIESTNVERPSELGERLCAQFWYEEKVKKRPRTLGFPKPDRDNPADREFYNLLRDLGADIAAELTRQKDTAAKVALGAAASTSVPTSAPTGPIVYLAHTTADLQQQRERVRRYLELEGLQVVPSRAYVDDAKFKGQVAADLAAATLFVQLLSSDPGPEISGSTDRRVAAQAALATAIGKPILQWRSATEELTPDIPSAHRALLDQASTVDLEVFKQSVVDRVHKLLTPERARTKAPDGYDCTVFVNMSEDVRPQANQIRLELDQRHAYVVLPPNLGAVGQNRLALEANLEDCDGLLLVAREAGAWVQSQLLQTRKVLARRERPLPVFQWTQPGPPSGPDFDAFLNGLRGGGKAP
jgi:TIR domain